MSRFRTVFLFELKSYLKNKVVIGVTLFLIVASAVLLFSPRFTGGGDAGPKQAAEDRPVMLVRAEEPEEAGRLREVFGAAFPDYDVRETSLTAEEIRGQILDGEITCAFDIGGPDACTYYVNNLGMTDQAARQAAVVLQEDFRIREMAAAGIPAEKAAEILDRAVQVETVNLGKDQSFTFFYTYIMIFALYMVIMLYGQMITTNVANEKSSRTMELLVTSVNTNAMIFGKVLATCLVGLVQLIRRRSLLKVSREIIGLAIAYVMAGIVYIVFEIFVVNYRPVLEAGQTFPEASFPSSHTVLAFVILATAIIAWGHLLENHSAIERLLQTAAVLLLIFAVGVRTLSGVHWLTDIVGGVLAGCAITSLYSTLVTEPGK